MNDTHSNDPKQFISVFGEKNNENQLKLPNGKIITFNDEQILGIKKINSWLKRTNENIFVLSGYAGTGKTTIIKKIIDSYRKGIAVSAPTHKAKKVIMRTTKKEGQTLPALLGLRPDLSLDNFNPNDPQFDTIAIPKITDYNLVIIDEASMINYQLYNLILKQIKGSNTKILFMGDPAQIPPVGEKESIVFNLETENKHHLTKVERQNDTNPLFYVYDDLRNNLMDIDGGIKRISRINDLNEGVLFTIDKRLFRNLVIDKFASSDFKENIDFVRMIAWKNDTVILSNKIIRNELFSPDSKFIEIGDLLMGYRTVSTKNFQHNIIENSADYKIVDMSPLEKNEYGIFGHRIKLEEITWDNNKKHEKVFIVDPNNIESINTYSSYHDTLRDEAKKNKKLWPKYYEFRRRNLLMNKIITYANGQYRNNYDIITKDLDYAYSITAHKSQGSTYDHVCVMENDINQNWLIKERNQIKYVALTRPTTTATVLTTKIDG